MAKLLKHFGIGGKKHSTHNSNSAYNSQKSCSVQDLCERIAQREGSCHSLSNSITLDRQRLTKRPPSVHTSTFGSFVRRSRDIVAKFNSNLGSTASSRECSSGDAGNNSEYLETKETFNKPTPKLLDDYSEPVDIQEIADNHKAASEKTEPERSDSAKPCLIVHKNGLVNQLLAPDDDYTVPYEINEIQKDRQEKLSPIAPAIDIPPPTVAPAIDVPPPTVAMEESYALPNKIKPPVVPTVNPDAVESQGEYDRPWACNNTLPSSDYEGLRRDPQELMNGDANKNGEQIYEGSRHDYVNTDPTVLRSESQSPPLPPPPTPPPPSPPPPLEQTEPTSVAFAGARPKVPRTQSCVSPPLPPPPQPLPTQQFDRRKGNYEEPWDLSMTQGKFEECFRAKMVTGGESAAGGEADVGSKGSEGGAPKYRGNESVAQAKDISVKIMSQHSADTRPMEGYEKPWDWKPDRKDGRPQEGYEKPWDWKQHQKDDRPAGEYDQPWDQRNLQQNLCRVKSAKESKDSATASLGRHAQMAWQGGHPHAGRESPRVTSQGYRGRGDSRPMEEYDQPWDQCQLSQSLTRQASLESHRRASKSAMLACQPVHQPGSSSGWSSSHRHHHHSGSHAMPQMGSWRLMDPKVPLQRQGWYHGSIGRFEAERLLRANKEGSFLVRKSESNRNDYSLSLKSPHGFMHMKIIYRDGRYILGQFSQPFDSIPTMIYNYSVNKLPIKGAEHISLLYPIINELL